MQPVWLSPIGVGNRERSAAFMPPHRKMVERFEIIPNCRIANGQAA
jgi:hypothetical protein